MQTLYQFVAPPSQCGYLPSQLWSLEYQLLGGMTPADYQRRLLAGWRRFGSMVFHPKCPSCSACQSLRVLVDRFRPNRSQRRAHKLNAGQVELRIGAPEASRAKLRLYDSFHAFQSQNKGWPLHPARDEESYFESFANNPFPTEEWCYYLDGRLIAVGYVDVLPECMSAIYFFYDPAERHRSLGTWNVMNIIAECAARRLPYLYLGYYVADCRSLVYKGNFVPNQVLGPDGRWVGFRG